MAPARVLDTRTGNGAPRAPVQAGHAVSVQVTGRGGVPSTGVSAVAVNVTVTQPTGGGYLTVYADGAVRPTASNLNFSAGQTVPNLVIAPVGANGKIALFNGSAGTVQLVADVAGYYLSGTAGSGIGNDVSWPQCDTTLPSAQTFGIVGVNGGLANNTNPCLAAELAWAQGSVGHTAQPLAALYVNTGNPGLLSSSWPTSNTYPAGATTPVSNPYGSCAGADDAACAYMYGYARAYDDVDARGVPTPTQFTWWLDVEITNSWEGDTTANVADLEGMTRYLNDIGAHVGIYASKYQWGVIAGTVSTNSDLSRLPNWIPGASSLADAQANCAGQPLMTGSITLTQYESGGTDYDNSCL